MPVLPVPLTAGINRLADAKPNELYDAQDLYFDESGQLRTRYGYAPFGNPVPDNVVLLDACEATTGWSVTEDGANLLLDNTLPRRGANCLKFDVDVSADAGNSATIKKSTIASVDITNAKGYLGIWHGIPSGALTDLTGIEVVLGKDASNYYKWSKVPADLTAAAYNFFRLDYDDAVETGTVDDADINYFHLKISYGAGYTDKVDWRIDDIRSYSATSTKPITSYFFHKRDDQVTAINLVKRIALCAAGANMFQYDEDSESWTFIRGSLTEFETAAGLTANRTRFSFAPLRNVVYMDNGVDDHGWFDGFAIGTNSGTPKVRFLAYLMDRIMGTGADATPLTLHYTAAAPANAQTLPSAVVLGGDEGGERGNAVFKMAVGSGAVALVPTNNQIFVVDVVNATSNAINTQNGGYSERALAEIGDSVIYQSDKGIESLRGKTGSAGGMEALDSKPITEGVQDLIRKLKKSQLNSSCGLHAQALRNYYFGFDSDDNNIPDQFLVLSTLAPNRQWTRYNWPNAYDLGVWEDSDGVTHYLLASGNGGQMYEVETGFEDDGVPGSNFRLETIEFDPITPDPKRKNRSRLNNFDWLDFVGSMNEGGIIHMEVYIGGKLRRVKEATDLNLEKDRDPLTIGNRPVGVDTVGGGVAEDGIDLYPFTKRVQLTGLVGSTIKVVLYGDEKLVAAVLQSLVVSADGEVYDLIPSKARQ